MRAALTHATRTISDLAKYNRQLVAGTSRNLESYGLRVVMPDFADLGSPQPAPVAAHIPDSGSQR